MLNCIVRMDLINTLKPGVPKRAMLFIAASIWSFAGIKLILIGSTLFSQTKEFIGLKVGGSIIGGLIFYALMFSKISAKHVKRIYLLPSEKPFILYFFNIKSYILMSIMMTSGILSRKYHLVPFDYLAIVYLTMGIPLLLSSFRFYFYGLYYSKLVKKHKVVDEFEDIEEDTKNII